MGVLVGTREDVVADAGEGGAGLRSLAGLATPMAVCVAATLRIADHIARGRRSAPELAAVLHADPRPRASAW
jgi:hypothetical protein